MEQVNRELQRVVSRWLQSNFQSEDLLTVTSASVTRDLGQAIITLGARNGIDRYVDTLNSKSRRIKDEIKKSLPWKTIPNLEFRADREGDTITKVEEILDNLWD